MQRCCITLERLVSRELWGNRAQEQSRSRSHFSLMINALWHLSCSAAECRAWERQEQSHNTVNIHPRLNPPVKVSKQTIVMQRIFLCPSGSKQAWDQMCQFSTRKATHAILGKAWSRKHHKSYLTECLSARDPFVLWVFRPSWFW